ncbi:DUF1877 domain-containing protein [Flavobacterium album]|uniref:DUF1877 domain-containing protein n=1 Tax=Flavobacterium album TaxID=2175091 RepID=A0A2S1R2R5_9FLAO|nr:DUF1877 domain-containing protein [Flavobacterium album]
MIANLLRVSGEELEEILKDSSKINQKLEDIYEQEEIDRNVIRDLDKSWEGLLFVLTGQALNDSDHPLSAVLFSGQIVDEDQDLGYGPGHYLTPEQVRELNEMLAAVTADDLKKRYDPKAMAGIYPDIWEDNSGLEYVLHYFNVLKEIYAGAAQNNEAVITFLG